MFRLIDGMFKVKPVPPLPSYTSVFELTERFSTYFINKISDLRKNLSSISISTQPTNIVRLPNCSLAEFSQVSPHMVRIMIEKSPSKSCLSDPIPTRILKTCIVELLPVITSLINSSLQKGVFPTVFKEGRLLPKIKKMSFDKENFANFRPITNLAFVSKVLERTVASQVRDHLARNHLYPIFQSAYRELHSTETALLRVHNDILRAIDQKKEVILVLLDLSAAFDTIDHDIIISRLNTKFGFTGTVLRWFESYIRDRSQKVVIGNTESKPQPLKSGVPQGSVLGPLLFILYFAPLEDVIKSHGLDFMMYADDTQLYITMNPDSRHSAINNLEQCIIDIQSFFLENRLSCNPSKTEIVHLYSRFSNRTPISSINISHQSIMISKEARNLGVIFDKHLTMSSQVNNLCRTASLALRNIGRVRKYLDQSSAERLVHAFITSKLDYCNSLLYGLPAKQLSKMQRLQNSAARLVTKTKCKDHITPVLRQLHWLPVNERIVFKVLLLTFKVLNGYAPSYLSSLLEHYVPGRTLRSASKGLLIVPKSTTATYGDRAFSIAAPKLWNDLPVRIRNADSINQFKSLVKTHLFEKCF